MLTKAKYIGNISSWAIFPSPKFLEAKRSEFSKDFIDEALKFSTEAGNLLKDLLTINSFEKLDKKLSHKFSYFVHLKVRLSYLFLTELSDKIADEKPFKNAFLRFLRRGYEDLKDTFKTKAVFLTSSQRECLLSAVEGWFSFSLNFTEGFFRTKRLPIEESVFFEVLKSFLKAEMCITTTFLLLSGDINERGQKALPLLARAAYKYVIEGEDILLAEDPELKRRLIERTESISLGELEQRLGLPGRN